MNKEQLEEKIALLAEQQGNQSSAALAGLLKDVIQYVDGQVSEVEGEIPTDVVTSEELDALSDRVSDLEQASGGSSSLTVGRVDATGLAQQTKAYEVTANKELFVLQSMIINGAYARIEGESDPDVLIVKIDVIYNDNGLVFGSGYVREVHLVRNRNGRYVGLLVPTSSGGESADKYVQVLCVGAIAGKNFTDIMFKPLSGYAQ